MSCSQGVKALLTFHSRSSREVQGRESDMFCSYFNGPLVYWKGGIASGFNHVEPTEDNPNLFQIYKGKKKIHLTQQSLLRSSLKDGDSFVLHVNDSKAWVWHGKNAKPMERYHANTVAETMCTEGTAIVLYQGEEEDDFWGYLPEDTGSIQESVVDRSVVEFKLALYRLPGDLDADPEEVARKDCGTVQPFVDPACLDDGDVFLIDGGWHYFIWIGKDADRSEKLASMVQVDKYCKEFGRPLSFPVTIVKSGSEPKGFKDFLLRQ